MTTGPTNAGSTNGGSTNAPAIEIAGLRKAFGGIVAVDGLDLVMASGTVLAVLGPNGAGKTTTIHVCATLLAPDAGSVRVCGYDVVADADAVRHRISLTGQFAAVDLELTGAENLVLFGRLLGLSKADAGRRARELLERFGLGAAGAQRAKSYSGGMRRRLDLAVSLVRPPELMFLDEPSTGLDPRSRSELWDVVRELRAGGTSVLLTTQYLEEADQLADRIVVVDHGHVIAEGTSAELKRRVGAAAEPKLVPQEPSLDDVFMALTGHHAEPAWRDSDDADDETR